MDFGFDSSDGRTFYFATKESSLVDPQYRYRYDEPIITVSGKKGNQTTYFENSEYFAEKIRMPSEYFTKYIAGRLSCGSKFDSDKKCQTFRGDFTFDKIREYLFEFVKNYLICNNCDYPETFLQKNKNRILIKHCESCGTESNVNCKSIDKAYDFIDKKIKS